MDTRTGQIADKYRVLGVVRDGAVGITYEAESLATGERVALKRFEVRGDNSWKLVELFQREARTLTHLAHSSIPPYRDAIVEEDRDRAVLWLPQSLAHGRSLTAWIETGGRCDEHEAKRIARALLSVLAYLHQLRPAVIHRDIKPANVFRGDDGSVLLVGFGSVGEVFDEVAREPARPQLDLRGLGATLLFLLTRTASPEIPRELGVSRGFAKWLARLVGNGFASAREALDALEGRTSSRRAGLVFAGTLGVVIAATAGSIAWIRHAAPRHDAGAARTAIDPYPSRLALPQYEEILAKRSVAAHSTIVFGVAVSPDGKRVATASRDAAVKLWDASTFALIRSHGHAGPASGVGFTRDNKTLVSSGDHTLRFWDVESGSAIRTIDLGAARATHLDMSSDAIVVGSFDGSARVFDLEGKPLHILAHSPGKGRVLAASFSPDGKTIATVGDDARALIWDAATGTIHATLQGHAAAVTAASFSADGTTLATTSDDRTVRVWNVPARRELSVLRHDDEVFAATFSRDGNYLLTGGKDARLRLFRAPTYTLAHTKPESTMTAALTFASDSEVIAAHSDGTLEVYRMPGVSLKLPTPKFGPPPTPANDSKEAALVFEARKKLDHAEGRALAIGEAETLCARALELKKDYAPAFVQLSRAARRRAPPRAKDAHDLLDKAEKLEPQSYDVHLHRAWTFEAEGNIEGARKSLSRAASLDPARVDGDALYARLLNAEKAWDEAIKRATRAVEGTTDPFVQYLGWQELSQSYRAVGEFEAADSAYRKIIAASPDSAWARGNYADFLVGRAQYGRALELVKEAESRSKYGALAKTSAEAHVGAGIGALWDHKTVAEARAHFETAVEKDAKNANAWYGVAACDRVDAMTYRDKQKLARSKQALQVALSIDPGHWWAKKALDEHDKLASSI